MPAPVFQAAGVSVGAIAGTVAPAWPVHVAGDIGILMVNHGGWHAAPLLQTTNRFEWSDAKGFKPAPFSPGFGGALVNTFPRYQSDSTSLHTFWKRAASAAELAPVIKVNGTHAHAVILTFRGCGSVGDPFSAAAVAYEAGNAATKTLSGVTTAEVDALIALLISNSGFVAASGWANANLTGVLERLDDLYGSGDGSGLFAATGVKAAAGATGTSAVTFAGLTYSSHVTLALSQNSRAVNPTPYIYNRGALVQGSTVDIVVPWPVHEIGDVGLLVVESGAWPGGLITAAGFVAVANSPQRAGSSGAAGAVELSMYWCRATSAAMASPTVDFVAGKIRGQIITIKGCKPTGNPFNVTAGDVTASSSATLSFPSITTTKDNCLILGFVGHGLAGYEARVDTVANVNLEYPHRYFDYGTNLGIGRAAWNGRKAAAGVVGATSATIQASSFQARLVVALDPTETIFEADQGTFSDVGQVATLSYNRSLVGAGGVYAITGQANTFVVSRGYLFEAATGVYSFAGQGITVSQTFGGNWTRQASKDQDVWVKQSPLEN